MRYDQKLQLILETIAKHDFIVISDEELSDKIKEKIPGEYYHFTDDLKALGYIEPNSTTRTNGAYVSGFSIKEKGKGFLAEGGFTRQRAVKQIRDVGGVIIFIVTVATFLITMKQCRDTVPQQKTPNQQVSRSTS